MTLLTLLDLCTFDREKRQVDLIAARADRKAEMERTKAARASSRVASIPAEPKPEPDPNRSPKLSWKVTGVKPPAQRSKKKKKDNHEVPLVAPEKE